MDVGVRRGPEEAGKRLSEEYARRFRMSAKVHRRFFTVLFLEASIRPLEWVADTHICRSKPASTSPRCPDKAPKLGVGHHRQPDLCQCHEKSRIMMEGERKRGWTEDGYIVTEWRGRPILAGGRVVRAMLAWC